MANFDRIKGALYGVAVGDALGGPLEFMSREAVRKAYPAGLREMVGGGWLHLLPGETTDDTAMTLCVAEGILEAESRTALRHANDDELAAAIGSRFIRWLDGNPPGVEQRPKIRKPYRTAAIPPDPLGRTKRDLLWLVCDGALELHP